jgi:hypothetical protein
VARIQFGGREQPGRAIRRVSHGAWSHDDERIRRMSFSVGESRRLAAGVSA